ncbi:MAG: hypothetical protein QW248_05915 [Candidatus Nitrosocaldus sp.]
MYVWIYACMYILALREVYLSRSDTGKEGTPNLVLKSTNTGKRSTKAFAD